MRVAAAAASAAVIAAVVAAVAAVPVAALARLSAHAPGYAAPEAAPAPVADPPATVPAAPATDREARTVSPDTSQTSAHPGDSLRVYLLTMGQGDLVWEKFGHNAIRIVDLRDGTDLAWEWGVFDFAQENFWPRLIRGEMLYSMAEETTERLIYKYDYFDRAVWSQELALTPEQKWRLREAIRENYRPENREYLYDYYRDNCSTRVRDMLDLALGGRLRGVLADDTTSTTYRWHTRRLLSASPLAYTGIQLALGNPADHPITAWEEGFLPMRLQEHLRGITVPVEDGERGPLVRDERRLLVSERPPTPRRAPSRLGWFGALGVVFALLTAGSAVWAGRGGLTGRVAFVGVAGGWSLVAGVAGALVLGAWLLTSHHFWGWNENLLQVSPLSLVVAVGLLPALWRGRVGSGVATLALVVAAASVAGFALQPLPGLDQVNGEIIALALPVNLGVAYAARTLATGPEPGPEDRAAAAAGLARAA